MQRRLKNFGKRVAVAFLGWQVRRLRAKHHVRTVGVVGGYGKTSTKTAIATVLAQHYRVRFQAGNYNDLVSVPLVFFGERLPSLFNPFAWLLLLLRNERQIRGSYPYDIIVLELGTDGPGQIAAFGQYVRLDLAVLTSIAFEHMEFFSGLPAVAHEELAVREFSDRLILNADLCGRSYWDNAQPQPLTFGYDAQADYRLDDVHFARGAFAFKVHQHNRSAFEARLPGVAKAQVYSACAAMVVAELLGVPRPEMKKGIAAIVPVSGRMEMLAGIRGSVILDETYNSSPSAVKAALDTLYGMRAPQKIALLGNMNELGKFSKQAHTELGKYCDPRKLDLVLTLGPDANKYLAPAAITHGCAVATFDTPYEAGAYLQTHIREHAAVLVKGSQNNVFAEEAVKLILADPEDAAKLVRQSDDWLRKKAQNFGIK